MAGINVGTVSWGGTYVSNVRIVPEPQFGNILITYLNGNPILRLSGLTRCSQVMPSNPQHPNFFNLMVQFATKQVSLILHDTLNDFSTGCKVSFALRETKLRSVTRAVRHWTISLPRFIWSTWAFSQCKVL
jgi:hypothetical protein